MANLQLINRKSTANVIYKEGIYSLSGTTSLLEETKRICNGDFIIYKTIDSTQTRIGRLYIDCSNSEKGPMINISETTIEELLIITPIVNEMIIAIEAEYSDKNTSFN